MQVFHTALDVLSVKRGFKDAVEQQLAQGVLWVPVFLAFGIGLYFALPFEPSVYVSIAAFVLPFIAWIVLKSHEFLNKVLIVLLCVGAGFCVAKLRTESVYTPILQRDLDYADVTGRIESVEHYAGKGGVRIVLEDVEIEDVPPQAIPRKIRIKIRKDQDLKAGQRVKLLAGLSAPSPPLLPGGFDFQRYMYFSGIGAVGFSYGGVEVLEDAPQSTFRTALENFRSHITYEAAIGYGASGGVAAALLVGQKSAIEDNDQEAMRESGLAHMLAISGLHVGLFFGFVFFTTRFLLALNPQWALHYPIKKYAAAFAMIAALFYMFVAGATIPTQRAVLMTAIVFLAIMLDRTPLSMRLVAFAAIVVLLIAPESLISASFQMSFSAVAALIAFYTAIRPYWARIHRQAGWWKRAGLYLAVVMMTSLIATFATAPFALFHFQTLALFSVLANVLAMPVLAFIVMPFAVVFFLLKPLGLEGIALHVMDFGVGLILRIAHFVSGLDYSVFQVSLWPSIALVFFALAFIGVLLVEGRAKVWAVLPFIAFMITITQSKLPDILVSEDANVIAIYDEEGLLFSNAQKERYAREQWLQAYGLSEGKVQKWPKEGALGDLVCGDQGCRLTHGTHKISFLRDLNILAEECAWADLVIAQDPISECEASKLHRFSPRDAGFYKSVSAIYLNESSTEIRYAAQRGMRPWVADTQKRNQ